MSDFKGKTGPKVPVIEQRNRTSGTKNGGQRAKKMARLLAEVKAKPLDWNDKR